MSGRETEARKLHILLMIESAQREGRTESEIEEMVKEATEADTAALRSLISRAA